MTGQQTKRIAAIVALCNEIKRLRERLAHLIAAEQESDDDVDAEPSTPTRRVG